MAMVSSTDFMRASERPTAIATLNCHRRLTPSCGGHHTYRGENSGPARMITENLTPRPGIGEQNLPGPDSCSAAKKCHLMTSSARASSVGGIVKPSASAVAKLHLVG